VTWDVKRSKLVEAWVLAADAPTQQLFFAAIDVLADDGPALGRLLGRRSDMSKPLADLRAACGVDEAEVARLADVIRAEYRAARLREIRAALGVSQATLAAETGVSQNRVSQIESGQVERARIDTLRRYIEGLGGNLVVEAEFGDTRLAVI
jgi:DNA-binding XRE family transcriptional regulator